MRFHDANGRHAQLHPNGDRIEVEDLASSNGTFLLGDSSANTGSQDQLRLIPHQRQRLRVGDTLRIGPATLAVQLKAQPQLARIEAQLSGRRTPVLVDPVMQRLYDLVARAARRDISVLILGETGVGKELIAETLHRRSARVNGRFLLLNCAALPENLLESELFGHEKGAFTGAHATRPGLLEESDGGTVFLDEIAELPLSTQAKLLRVLEERTVMRLGGNKARRIDVRFVTATSRDLLGQARAGQFRSDLYYRIAGLVVRVPPLRERPSEIEPMVQYFLRQLREKPTQPELTLSGPALAMFQSYNWPGNVRELRNVVERAALIADEGVIEPEHVLLDPSAQPPSDGWDVDVPTRVDHALGAPEAGNSPKGDERARLIQALDACAGNQRRAAELLGISRRTLVNRLDKWNLPRPKKTPKP